MEYIIKGLEFKNFSFFPWMLEHYEMGGNFLNTFGNWALDGRKRDACLPHFMVSDLYKNDFSINYLKARRLLLER